MEMNYSTMEKKAIVKVLKDVMYADGYAHSRELSFFGKVVEILSMSRSDFNDALELDVDSSVYVLKQMNYARKKQLSELMEILATVDGNIRPEELSICTAISIAADLPV